MKRACPVLFVLLASMAGLACPSRAASLPAPPFVVNCGPPAEEGSGVHAAAVERPRSASGRPVHLPDTPFRAALGYGHRSGEGYHHWHGGCRPALGPPWEIDLFSSGRVAPERYSFVVPSGAYQVTIGICEGDAHLAGQRLFDVLVNDRVVFRDVDPIAWAGYKEPLMLTARAQVEAGRLLTVSFQAKTEREPIVSAIWVTPAAPRQPGDSTAAPLPPSHVRVVGSYAANLLSWHRPRDFSLAGFHVRRRVQGQQHFELVTPSLLSVHRWVDRDVVNGETYEYQVGSQHVSGGMTWSAATAATPRELRSSTLPVYQIELTSKAWNRLLANVHEEHTERGTLSLRGTSYPIEIRIRGASTRHAAKKSYRIRFTDECPFARNVTYLKAEPMDHTMQQEKLSCDLFRAVGAHVSQADYVNLVINGRYEGVYLDMEPIRAPFKQHEGLDPEGTLIRANTFQHRYGFDTLGDLRGDVGSLELLRDFIGQINDTPRGEFERFVRESTDWPRVLDYLALIVLTHRSEIEANDYFFYRAPATGRWSFLPWDHNNGNFQVGAYANGIGEPTIDVFPQTLQQLGWEPNHWYVLPSRIFHTPGLRSAYLDRLEELTRSWLVSGRLNAMVEANHNQLRAEYPLDPYRWPFTDSDPFASSADDLKRFIGQHARRILRQIGRERSRQVANVIINEFSFGEQEGWIELHNRGEHVEPLRHAHLVTKDHAGNWRRSLRSEEPLQPGEYRVIRLSHTTSTLPRFQDAEARERWEIERSRSHQRGAFPGYSPRGGFLGLVRAGLRAGREASEDDDPAPETLLDFYFYGPLPEGRSYGRLKAGFGFQMPSPQRANASALAP